MSAVTALERPRPYYLRSLIYVLARGPLAFAYFLILGVGLSVGVSTIPVFGIGLAVLVAMLGAVWLCAIFERDLVRLWFGADPGPMTVPPAPNLTPPNPIGRLTRFLSGVVTWKSLAYIFIQVPVGFLVWLLFALLLAITAAFLWLPFAVMLDAPSRLAQDVPSMLQHIESHGRALALGLGATSGLVGLLLFLLILRMAAAVARWHVAFVGYMLAVTDTERQLAEARVAAGKERARADRSERSQRQLIVDASHELRNPIASIQGHLEALLDPDRSEIPADEARRYLEVVRKETDRLGSLVEDLLVVASGESGELRLAIRPVDVAAVATQVHGALAPIAQRDRKVKLVCESGELPLALADGDRLQQVLMNLVRNAITHTPEGGIVSISAVSGDDGTVRLSVADTGAGIPKEDLERIFDRFYRTDASRSRTTGGFGLGLSISRDLVQAMGGKLEVESEPDLGSRFTVTLRSAA